MPKTTLNPNGMAVPRGSYSLVNIAQPGRMVFIAGQTASDHDIVALSIFTTDVRYHRDINETRREVLGANFPTSTMVQVVALARPELILEVNATAVIA